MNDRWIRYVWSLIGLVGAGAVVAGLIAIALSVNDPIVRMQQVPQPALTKTSTVREARARHGEVGQAVDGQQVGLPAGVKCDVWELADGIEMLCYQGGK